MKRVRSSSICAAASKILKIRFRNPLLLEAALSHPSYRNESPCPKLVDFDRLEFFGDAILNYIICRKLFKVFPNANEGMLSRLRSILVSKRILCRIARTLQLTKVLRIGRSLRKEKEWMKFKLLADAFEALIASLYFDQGLARTEVFILRHFSSYFDSRRLFHLDPNPKSALQEITQKQWQKLPEYRSESAPGGIRTTVSVSATRKAVAVARSRHESEEKAARLLLRKLRQGPRRLKRASSGKKLRKTR